MTIVTSLSLPEKSQLDLALEHYATVLEKIEKAAPDLSEQQIVKLLTARDEVEATLPKNNQADEDTLVKLIELDRRLKQQAGALTKDNKLAECCHSLGPPKSSWWWHLQPPPPKPKKSAPFDWVWHGLTMICLVGASSFIANTSQVLIKEGFDVDQLVRTISQTTGVALIAGGSLTTQGRKTVANILSSLKIPHHYYPEANCAASVILLLCTFGIWRSLPAVGERSYKQAEQAYKQGQLAQAMAKYEQALVLNPHKLEIKVGLGHVHKIIGELDQAQSYYLQGSMQNDPASLNGLGTIILRKGNNLQNAKALFLLALENSDLSPTLEADIRANLGYTLLKISQQEEFKEEPSELLMEAEDQLRKAIKLTPSIPEDTPGRAMAHCYLAQLLEEMEDGTAQKEWRLCELANPATLEQYQLIKLRPLLSLD